MLARKTKKTYASMKMFRLGAKWERFLQNLSASLQKHSQVLVDFLQKHSQNLVVSSQKCSGREQNGRAKLETLLCIERGLAQPLHFVLCMAAEWEKSLRELLDSGAGMRCRIWELLFCYCTMIGLF